MLAAMPDWSWNVCQSLNEQRLSRSPFCDVILKCGSESSFAHSAVLAAASGFFEKILHLMMGQPHEASQPSPFSEHRLVHLEVDDLFVGMEHLFQDILTYMYVGEKGEQLNEAILHSLQLKLELRRSQPSPSLLSLPGEPPEPGVKVEVPPLIASEPASPHEDPSAAPVASPSGDSPPEIKMDVSFCHKCDLLFVSKEEFLIHRQMNCTRKFSCKSCGLLFTRVQTLLEHLIEVRHGESICSLCHFAAASSSAMDDHLQNHVKVVKRPYFCLQCDSRFPTRSALIQHLPKHSNETPFLCNICTKGFKWKQALAAHMVTHSTAKRYTCPVCGFSTAHSSVFKSHQRLHNGRTLKCEREDCSFETIRKHNLEQHRLTHSKEKQHQCEVCGKAFSLVKNMRRHARQHDDAAPKQECPSSGCHFQTLRSDKFLAHRKKCPFNLNPIHGAAGTPSPLSMGPVSGGGKTSSQKNAILNNLFNTVNPPNRTITHALPVILTDDTNPLSTATLDVTLQDMLKLSENLVLELDSSFNVKVESDATHHS